ncbi:MAG: hypothetical protein E7339_03425 [Clostridiales bacterium]|nr:hypothetical protein [Clostridiales bacterium]
MKTKQTNKLLVLVISLMMIVTLLAGLSITASAEEIGTETNTPVAEFVGKQVNLGGDISMKFHVRNNEDRPIESITVEVEFLGKLTYLTECEPHPTEDKVYIYTFEGINPQCLGDLMNVTILVGGSPVGHEKAVLTGYSVKENLINAYNITNDANMKQLIIDTLEYGAAAQVYRDYKTDALVTKDVDFISEGKTEVDVPKSSPVVNETVADSIKEATVNFSATNFIKVSYNDGEIKTLTSDAVAAYDFAKKMQFSAEGLFTLGYSVNDYCYDVINSEKTSEEMKSLAKALYNYGLSAHIVEGNHEGGTATCATQKVCTICGNGYGNLLDHNYIYTANDDANTITESCDKGCGHNKTITLKAPVNTVYDGNAKETVVDGSIDADYTVTYDKNEIINVGTYKATLTVGEVSVSLDFEITMATPNVTAPTANTLTYNGEAQELVSAVYTDFGTMLYSLTEEGEFTATIPTGTNAGSYTVYYRVQGNENVNDSAVASVTVEIAKAVASITAAPTPNTLTYSGEAQYLINAGETNVGTMVYSLTENDGYTTSIPQGTNAGDYTVWYYVQGDANHNDSAKDTVSVNIAKAPLTVTADAKIKSYGDENPTLTYTAEGLLGGDTLTGALSREEGENVGSYAITLGTLSADNYTISFEGADFTIQAKEVTEPIVTLDQTSYQYDGNVKEPKVISIVVDGRTLTEGADYTVSYEDNVYVNTEAKVVINFMGNYDGTFKKYFTITQDPDTTEFDGEWITVPKAQ